MKLARLAQMLAGHPERTADHQPRSAATTAPTTAARAPRALPLNKDGWGPLVPDVVQVPSDDIEALAVLMADRSRTRSPP